MIIFVFLWLLQSATVSSQQNSITKIHDIQGKTDTSPLVGNSVTVEAIVVGDFQGGDADKMRDLGGFFLQEEDSDVDGKVLTSEGIFVSRQGLIPGGVGAPGGIAAPGGVGPPDAADIDPALDVSVGDLVVVSGTVQEHFGETRLVLGEDPSIRIVSSGNTLPSASKIKLPFSDITEISNGNYQPDLERYEGMLVYFTDKLTVSDQNHLDRFNEVKLAEGDLPFQFTQTNDPDVDGREAHKRLLGARSITYDDGTDKPHQPVSQLGGFGPEYSTFDAVRVGDTISELSGVLSYAQADRKGSEATWRVRSTTDTENKFNKKKRSVGAPDVGGTLKVALMSLGNFFPTIDQPEVTTAIGAKPHGAKNEEELKRQTQKIVTAIRELNADIVGVTGIENDFPLVKRSLVGALGETYDLVDPGKPSIGTDGTYVGILFKPSVVEVVGTSTLMDSHLEALGLDVVPPVFDGPESSFIPLAATFQTNKGDRCITLSMNNFKSKKGPCPGDDDRSENGTGNCNSRRNDAAQSLVAWLDTEPTGYACENKAIIGNLNSYKNEDPIKTLENSKYINIVDKSSDDAHNVIVDGQMGTLDYVMLNKKLRSHVIDAEVWNVNSGYPNAIDYKLDHKRDPNIFDGEVPYRFSDRDPIIVGFNLGSISSSSTQQNDSSPTSSCGPYPNLTMFLGAVVLMNVLLV